MMDLTDFIIFNDWRGAQHDTNDEMEQTIMLLERMWQQDHVHGRIGRSEDRTLIEDGWKKIGNQWYCDDCAVYRKDAA
jgi:hypothetical protein